MMSSYLLKSHDDEESRSCRVTTHPQTSEACQVIANDDLCEMSRIPSPTTRVHPVPSRSALGNGC